MQKLSRKRFLHDSGSQPESMSILTLIPEIQENIFSFLERDIDITNLRLAFKAGRRRLACVRKLLIQRISNPHSIMTEWQLNINGWNFVRSLKNLRSLDLTRVAISPLISREEFCEMARLDLSWIGFPQTPGLALMFINRYRQLQGLTGRAQCFNFQMYSISYSGRSIEVDNSINNISGNYVLRHSYETSADLLYFLEVLDISKVRLHIFFPHEVYYAVRRYRFHVNLLLFSDDFDPELLEHWKFFVEDKLRSGLLIRKLTGKAVTGTTLPDEIFANVVKCELFINGIGVLRNLVAKMPLVRMFRVWPDRGDNADDFGKILIDFPYINYLVIICDDDSYMDGVRSLPEWIQKKLIIVSYDMLDFVSDKKFLEEFSRFWNRSGCTYPFKEAKHPYELMK